MIWPLDIDSLSELLRDDNHTNSSITHTRDALGNKQELLENDGLRHGLRALFWWQAELDAYQNFQSEDESEPWWIAFQVYPSPCPKAVMTTEDQPSFLPFAASA